MEVKSATINVANKIRNTNLSRNQGLMPLYELISNSIHAINERKEAKFMNPDDKGDIVITLIRNGKPEILQSISNNDEYPIKDIVVEDNGIGLNNANLASFTEADTDHKFDIGGKGIGRFVCLKAFKSLSVESQFKEGEVYLTRYINLKNTKVGFEDFHQKSSANGEFKTVCTLNSFLDYYIKATPKKLEEIANAIITHFQLYFISGNIPHIIIKNQNNYQFDLNEKYKRDFSSKIRSDVFEIGEDKFTLYLSKSNSAKSHRLHFCAHNRSVIEDWMGKQIIELGKNSVSDNDGNFFYAAFVVGKVLDESVNNERTEFAFPNSNENEDDDFDEELTLAKIRKKSISMIESMISEYLDQVRTKKIENYQLVVNNEMPQYRVVLSHKAEKVKKLDAGLNNHELDLALFKIESEWKAEIKQKGEEILSKKKDVTTLDKYKQLYEEYLSDLNEIGKADLARYIVHRKSILDLLDILTSKDNSEDKYFNEDLIHSLFFPIRTFSDQVPYEKQNLWLLDERLSYHSYLASDKTFDTMNPVNASENPDDRTDLFILSHAFAFAEEKNPPFHSITIVEFKKPERNNYVDNDDKKNPLDQVERYVEDLLEGRIKNKKGRTINITKVTPFYIYIVCDLTPSLVKILERREFCLTPDGLGYYSFKNKHYNGYIEIMTFDKIKADANKRNQILFSKLGLPND